MMILALVVGGVLRTVLGRFLGALVTGGAVSDRSPGCWPVRSPLR